MAFTSTCTCTIHVCVHVWKASLLFIIALNRWVYGFITNPFISHQFFWSLSLQGSLRVLLVLLHDFPEFLCDYHFSFCDVIPPNCIQMRNLILSAFPRNMRLPDPFTPNLKVYLWMYMCIVLLWTPVYSYLHVHTCTVPHSYETAPTYTWSRFQVQFV